MTTHSSRPQWAIAASPVNRTALAIMAVLLAGCAAKAPGGFDLETKFTAQAHSSRVRHIVLHYTAGDLGRSLAVLTGPKVSAHYLISDEDPPRVYRLLDENRSAWHAGDSQWRGQSSINVSSVGIEIVNPGWRPGPGGGKTWTPYSESQIQAVIALVRDIAQRHGVVPANVVAHSDIAPGRKLDPGPMFPWKRLAEAGLARWYDETAAQAARIKYQTQGVPDAAWLQAQLTRAGYPSPQTGALDTATRAALSAFQMRYRPGRYDGEPDAETAGILEVLK